MRAACAVCVVCVCACVCPVVAHEDDASYTGGHGGWRLQAIITSHRSPDQTACAVLHEQVPLASTNSQTKGEKGARGGGKGEGGRGALGA